MLVKNNTTVLVNSDYIRGNVLYDAKKWYLSTWLILMVTFNDLKDFKPWSLIGHRLKDIVWSI